MRDPSGGWALRRNLWVHGVDSPTEYVEFGSGDDVSGHCEMTGRSVFHDRVLAWLDGVLARDDEDAPPS